ncbi:MAG: helix-turn-helix domain-containing protein, partial [Oscillospiraceae bacterium]|nr:helix-turn-helix domain-containing protein [Oscillospiraceae bacterium]
MSEKRKKSCKEFFGERLKLLRAQKGISQEALAKKLGISKGSLGFYETCKNTPDIEVLNAVSNFFNVSLDYLLGYTENPTNDTDLQAVCNYTDLSEKAVKSLLMAKNIGNDWLHSTIEFVLEDLFEEVKARLEYPLTKVDEFTPVQIAGSKLLTGLMCYFNVQSSEDTSPIQNFVLI